MIKWVFEKDAAFFLIVVGLKQAVQTKKPDISETGQQGPGKMDKDLEGTCLPLLFPGAMPLPWPWHFACMLFSSSVAVSDFSVLYLFLSDCQDCTSKGASTALPIYRKHVERRGFPWRVWWQVCPEPGPEHGHH